MPEPTQDPHVDAYATADVRLLAVDGNSLAHRAYHAILGTDDAVGPFVTAGFFGMLASVWAHGPFDGILVAFDSPDNRRKRDWPEYKANRTDDPDLRQHLGQLVDHVRATGLTVGLVDGAEGDDVLAAVTDQTTARGWGCAVLSSDRDLLALVSDHVRLLRPVGTMSDLRVYDPTAVLAEYHVRPEQYTDLAAMRGDPSDGLDGVNGIGPKIAARLLRDHDDLGGIYRALCHLPPKVEAAMRAGRDVVERNRLLMSPLPHVPVDVDAALAVGIDLDRIDQGLRDIGLDGGASRLRWAVERPALPPMPPPPDDDVAPVAVPAGVLARRTEDAATDGEQNALF